MENIIEVEASNVCGCIHIAKSENEPTSEQTDSRATEDPKYCQNSPAVKHYRTSHGIDLSSGIHVYGVFLWGMGGCN